MCTLRAIIALTCLCAPSAALARTSAKPPDLDYGEQTTEA